MKLETIIDQYQSLFLAQYGTRLLPEQHQALNALHRCRTSDSGEMHLQCTHCNEAHWHPVSCGHRSCPKCQNHEASQWLERQQAKLLPVEYFMVTFTLPYQLRRLACQHQKVIYSLFFACVSSTLKDFGLNPDKLGVTMGMTAVLHTHNRRLDYHLHIHLMVPGGVWINGRNSGKNLKGSISLMSLPWLKSFVPVFSKLFVNRDFLCLQKHLKNG